MKRVLATILLVGLGLSIWAVKPYYRIGQSNKSVQYLSAEITGLLLGNQFDVLGIYHPNEDAKLCVIIFTCDELTSMATSVADKGAFGAVLKIGLINKGNTTDITLLNPHYINYAYFNANANKHEAVQMTSLADSLVISALSPLVGEVVPYGRDISSEDLRTYQFLPTMSRFEDVVELNEYDAYIDAVANIKSNALNGVSDCKLVYELSFHDKEMALFGVAFVGKNNPDEQMLALMGDDCIAALPLEILVQGRKAYILNGKFRIPLFNSGLSRVKILKIMGIASNIKTSMKNIAEQNN